MARRSLARSVLAASVVLGLFALPASGQYDPNQKAPPAKPTTGHGQPQYTGPLPPIQVIPGNVDFGIANPDHPIRTKVRVTNTSPSTIRIAEVRPTCKCTVPTISKDTLAPGESIDIDLVLDLRGSLGPVRKPFDIFIVGWERPFTAVVIGTLQYPISIEPADPQATPNRKGEIVMRSTDGRPFKVISVHGRTPQVVERKPPEGERSLEWTIQWDLTHTREWPHMLVIETDHPDCQVMNVRLKGAVVSQSDIPYIKNWPWIFAANRTNVNFGAIPAGGSVVVDIPITRDPEKSVTSEPCAVSFSDKEVTDTLGEAIKVEVVEIQPVDGRPNDELYFVKITNIAQQPQMVCHPIYFRTNTHADGEKWSRCWLGGVLRAGDAAQAQVQRGN